MKNIFILLTLSLFAVSCNNNQQNTVLPNASETDIIAALGQLWKGMIDADESILRSITAEELVYGHSGGKVQNKSEFIAEILSKDPLVYIKIETFDQTIQMAGNAAVVRHIFTAETINTDGEPVSLRVGNTFVWLLQDGQWKLLVRQAYRL